MSKVAFVKIDYKSGIEKAVEKAMQLAEWKKYVNGKNIFVKINSMCSQTVPGLNTSPFVLEAVIKVLRELPKVEITIGDTDLATVKQLDKAVKVWGYLDLAEKHGCEFVNLSKEKIVEKEFNGNVFKKLLLPECVANSDCIVSIPVLKTHGLTKITCALKNSWGFLPRFRHQYHMVADKAIAEINSAIKVDFVVADATVCVEGKGPRTGKSKICDVVLASDDRVAVDAVASAFTGLNPSEIGQIVESHNLGVGKMDDIKIVGDKFFVNNFEPPKQNIVFFFETKFRRVPVVKELFFGPMFDFFSWVVTQYNTKWWYWTQGKKDMNRILKHNFYGPLYKKLFSSSTV